MCSMIGTTEGYTIIPGEREAFNEMVFHASSLKAKINAARANDLLCHRGTQILPTLEKNPGQCHFDEPFWTDDLNLPLLGGDAGQVMFESMKFVPAVDTHVGLMTPLDYDWCEKLDRLDPGIELPHRDELDLDYEFLYLSGHFYVGITKVGFSIRVPTREVDVSNHMVVDTFTTVDFSVDPSGVAEENLAFLFDRISSNKLLGFSFATWFMSSLEESGFIAWNDDDMEFGGSIRPEGIVI